MRKESRTPLPKFFHKERLAFSPPPLQSAYSLRTAVVNTGQAEQVERIALNIKKRKYKEKVKEEQDNIQVSRKPVGLP